MQNGSILKNTRFLFILFTAFLSIFGIGLIIPVLPFIVQTYAPGNPGEIALHVGILISLYALCQFFAAPVLGAVSDKYGRRPVLLLCLFGSAIGYTLFGIGGSIAILYIARIIDGLTGGDISTVFAYIADITPPQERGKYYGIIGAVIGLGFMIGPTVGGLLSQFGLTVPLFFAAGVTLLNMLWGFFVLPESLDFSNRSADFSLHHLNPLKQLQKVASKTHVRTILLVGLYYYLPFAFMQGVTSVYYKDILHWNPQNIGFVFLVLGIGDMFTQGFLSGKLLPKFGEITMLFFGFLLTALAFGIIALLPVFPVGILVYVYIFIYALGSGLFEPSFGALVSHSAPPQEQGRVQGAAQSMESIARIIGPIVATLFYGFLPNLPYITAVIISIGGIVYLLANKRHIITAG